MNKPEQFTLAPGIVSEVPVTLIHADPTQPRTEFAAASLDDLAADIADRGVRVPIELRPDGDQFVIETGERRFRAAMKAGLDTIPALLAQPHELKYLGGERDEEFERFIHQANENILREELSPVDKARMVKRLRDEFGIKTDSLPEVCAQRRLGNWSRSTISNMIRMLELPDWVLTDISSGRVPASAAKHILQIADLPKAMEELQSWWAQLGDAGGSVHESDVTNEILDIVSQLYLHARSGYGKDAPRYDVDKHKDACGLRKIGPTEYITDELGHAALQAQHPTPDKNSPAAAFAHHHSPVNNGGDNSEESSKGKDGDKGPIGLLDVRNVIVIEAYLVDWWRHYISMHARTPGLINAVVSWSACGAPLDHSGYFGVSHTLMKLEYAQGDACEEIKRTRLGSFLAHDMDDDDRLALFDWLLGAMGDQAIVDIVQHHQWVFEEVYQIDIPFVELHNKATLDKLVRDTVAKGKAGTEARNSWTDCTKLDEMRGWVLARAADIGVPKDLVKVWREYLRKVK